MSELDILELETEHAELLPEREALGTGGYSYYYNYPTVNAWQYATAQAYVYHSYNSLAAAAATNYVVTS